VTPPLQYSIAIVGCGVISLSAWSAEVMLLYYSTDHRSLITNPRRVAEQSHWPTTSKRLTGENRHPLQLFHRANVETITDEDNWNFSY